MDLFTPSVEKDQMNPNFVSVLDPRREPERRLFQAWADGFVDRDNKLVNEFQTTFNSSFWEIYLHALFKSYGFRNDWSNASPDFCLNKDGFEFVVEATTANAARGQPNEWDRTFSNEELTKLKRFKDLNTEAIIRLSNSIQAKYQKYQKSYRAQAHVIQKPFVLAVAPFEQPHFNLQYDRPIRALLYDYYVDEDAYLDNPSAFPFGPPAVSLGHVLKANGSPIDLGLFNNPAMAEISAIIFSSTATWGKLTAMAEDSDTPAIITSVWATPPSGAPEKRRVLRSEHTEEIHDGLQIYHNAHANQPLNPEIFRRQRVVQHYYDNVSEDWVYESRDNALQFRQSIMLSKGTH